MQLAGIYDTCHVKLSPREKWRVGVWEGVMSDISAE